MSSRSLFAAKKSAACVLVILGQNNPLIWSTRPDCMKGALSLQSTVCFFPFEWLNSELQIPCFLESDYVYPVQRIMLLGMDKACPLPTSTMPHRFRFQRWHCQTMPFLLGPENVLSIRKGGAGTAQPTLPSLSILSIRFPSVSTSIISRSIFDSSRRSYSLMVLAADNFVGLITCWQVSEDRCFPENWNNRVLFLEILNPTNRSD